MQKNSILRKFYNEQQTTQNVQSKEISGGKGDILCFFKWMLVGALTQSIVLAPIIILYVRQINVLENMVTTMSGVTSTSTSTTTTPFSYRWNSTGSIVAGMGGSGSGANQLQNPYGLGLDSSNSLYVVDRSNNRVQKYESGSSVITTVAGQPPTDLNQPGYLAIDSNNGFYVSDCNNHRVRYWANGATTGTIVAGTGVLGATSEKLNTPRGVSLNPSNNGLYVADQYNHRIMYYTSGNRTGIVVAGGNGCASSATQLCQPVGLQFDLASNTLFITNFDSHTLVRWTIGNTAGTFIAGTHNTPGISPTSLNGPTGLVLDSMANIYVADTNNHRIMLFMKGQGNGTTIAGQAGINGSTLFLLNTPFWVSLDAQCNLYVSDRDNQRVIKFMRY